MFHMKHFITKVLQIKYYKNVTNNKRKTIVKNYFKLFINNLKIF